MNQRIEKITVSLPVETLRLADENRERLGFQNRSELIDASIREFVSRDILRQFSGELAELYGKIERSEMKDLEEHLSKLSYKIAVELAQVNLLLASLLEIPYDETQKLRGKAVRLVNQSRGYVPLKNAIKSKMKLDIMEEDDE
ncbi:ribbon-helix-helix domain-containing protein [Caproicibacter sp. BJN0012]|uniref:ribbon-helix-helix domain-containing protein n=1 Tax=Caproicibacter sp. BJN0012 TaxID=3110227 RepID=UPI002E124674